MELTYMNQLQDWKERNKRGKGVSESEINNVETKHNITLPESYKEFLRLSGVYCAAVVQGHMFEYIDEKQKRAQDLLKEYSLKNLIKKPFWVIADDESTFWYLHLDEGDNPAVHRLDCESYEDWQDEHTFGIVGESFQAWIEEAISNYEKYKKYEQ